MLLLLLPPQAVVKKDVYAIVEALRSRCVTKFASLGFCWGASMAIQALHDGETFSAAGMLHPSLFGQVRSCQLQVSMPCCKTSRRMQTPLCMVNPQHAVQHHAGI
jgi:dienelactone hydrolase